MSHTRNRPRVIFTLAPEVIIALGRLARILNMSRSAVVDEAVVRLAREYRGVCEKKKKK